MKVYPLGQPNNQLESNIDPNLLSNYVEPSSSRPTDQNSPFGLIELLVLADLYNTLSQFHRAVNVIRAGVRWLQGRAKEHIWDKCSDDREYDLPGFVRQDENGASVMADMEGENSKQGFHPLDINARHRLAIARLKLGHIEEGKVTDFGSYGFSNLQRKERYMQTSSYRKMPSNSRLSSENWQMRIFNASCTTKPVLSMRCSGQMPVYALFSEFDNEVGLHKTDK